MVATFVEAPGYRPKLRLLPTWSESTDGTDGTDGTGDWPEVGEREVGESRVDETEAETAWVDVPWADLAKWARAADRRRVATQELRARSSERSRSSCRQRPTSPTDKATFRRRRIVAAGLVVAGLFGLLVAVQAILGWSGAPPLGTGSTVEPTAAHIWVVQPGDTLWSIALASGARGDIRPLVDKLDAEVHGLPLQPGERILVP